MLHFNQQVAHVFRHVFAEQQAYVRIQLIHIAHGMNTQAVFGHPLVVAQAGGAFVTCSGGNLCQSVSHGVFPVHGGLQKCGSQRKL